MSAQYKLNYFNIRGLAETARLLFAVGGAEYEDFRFPFTRTAEGAYLKPEFDAVKNDFPWGQVPVLEVEGRQIGQSRAIERFLAKRFGLFGNNDLETVEIDSVSEQINDVRNAWRGAMGKDDAIKAAGVTVEEDKTNMHKFLTEEAPKFLGLFERYLTANSKSDFFVGNSISLADVQFYSHFTNPMIKLDLTAYPRCAAVVKAVGDNDKIKAWIAKRPETAY